MKLDRIHQQWVATLDAIRDPIFVIDHDDCVVRANESFAALVGLSFDELLNHPIDHLLPWLVTALTANEQATAVAPDGRLFVVRRSPQADRLDGSVVILEDISLQIVLEQTRQSHFEQSMRALAATLKTLSMVLDRKDPYTVEHNQNVATVAKRLAGSLGYSADASEGIYLAGLSHDIGKLGVPSDILNRPGPLLVEETNLIRLHPKTGYGFVEEIEFPWPIHAVMLQHHERLDGSGYPAGLSGGEIADSTRIVIVADVMDAMSANRPYRTAPGVAAAVAELRAGRGERYDSDVVDAMIHAVDTSAETLPQNWTA